MRTIRRLLRTTAFHAMLTLNGLLLFVGYLAVSLLCIVTWPFQKLICFMEFIRRKLIKWRRTDLNLMRTGIYKYL